MQPNKTVHEAALERTERQRQARLHRWQNETLGAFRAADRAARMLVTEQPNPPTPRRAASDDEQRAARQHARTQHERRLKRLNYEEIIRTWGEP